MEYFLLFLRIVNGIIFLNMRIHPNDDEIVQCLHPWHVSLATLLEGAEDRHLKGIGILGLSRRTERAGDIRRGWRTLSRFWCDETNGLFAMSEEDERSGLDCMICNLIPEKPFAIRTGRFNGRVVKRNSSQRENIARRNGRLSSDLLLPGLDKPSVDELRQVTLAYSIENDRTLGGMAAWYMSKIQLVREQFDGIDVLAEIARYDAPTMVFEDARRVVAVPRTDELELWRTQIRNARKQG